MAIALEFLDFIVPISIIDDKYPGGWNVCLENHRDLIGKRVWYDDHLFRDGAMAPTDIQSLVANWKSMGFETIEERDGRQAWKDVCVVEGMFGGPTLPCDWLTFDSSERIVYLTGTAPGEVAWPNLRD